LQYGGVSRICFFNYANRDLDHVNAGLYLYETLMLLLFIGIRSSIPVLEMHINFLHI